MVFAAFCRREAFLDLALVGVLVRPVPVRAKSDTPSSRALRGVETPLAMLDFGESRCAALELDRAKCEVRLPPYDDLDCLSGVNGEESRLTGTVLTDDRWRGDGVRGMRPPAVRVEKIPVWDLTGVDMVADAIVTDLVPMLVLQAGWCSDVSSEIQETQLNGSWICCWFSSSAVVLDISKMPLQGMSSKSVGRPVGWQAAKDLMDLSRDLEKGDVDVWLLS